MAGRRNVGVDVTSTSMKDMAKGAGIAAAEGGPGGSTFVKAIVAEIITSPEDFIDLFDDEPDEGDAESENPFRDKIKNLDWAKKAPRGSLLLKELTDKSSGMLVCAYPMIQSHLKFPVSVGEQVWMYVNGEDFYWLSRVAGSNVTEDTNFTHIDRDMETPHKTEGDAKEKSDKEKGILKRIIARFNNGAGGDQGGSVNAPEGFDIKSVKKNSQFTRSLSEAVPRFTPRPGDFCIQGSNNTLISLGTDRGWTKLDEDFSVSNAHSTVLPESGAIDIVVGRGMPEDPEAEIKPSDEESEGTEPTRTGFRRIIDEDGGVENNKLSKQNKETINQSEGDPDFHLDASRIYVSMNSSIDEKLTLNESMPSLALKEQPGDKAGAAIAIKSNEIRVVARHDGSVRIVKEKEEGKTGASIIMLADGSIHITGEQIFIGKTTAEGGQEAVEPAGPFKEGDMNPYVRFSVLEKYLNDVSAAITGFCDTVSGHICPMNAPSPQIISAVGTLKSKMTKAQKDITKIQSTRIFGE